MDDELISAVYQYLFHNHRAKFTRDCKYCDAVIVFIELFRVGRQLSAQQAMNRRHWPVWTRRIAFPSYSQFNRRVKYERVGQHIAEMSRHFRDLLPKTDEKAIDGKPLLVGGFSKDPDARRGKAPGGWANGYKLHAVVDSAGAVETWHVTSLKAGEATVARTLLSNTDLRNARVRGDSNYDSVALYNIVADAGGRFIAQRRRSGTGLGHHPQHADRLRAIQELEATTDGLRRHCNHRIRVEQIFGRLTTVAFGLWSLPPSVRRLDRVRRYVDAKITLYHVYLVMKTGAQIPCQPRKCA